MFDMSRELFDEVMDCPFKNEISGLWRLAELPNGSIIASDNFTKLAFKVRPENEEKVLGDNPDDIFFLDDSGKISNVSKFLSKLQSADQYLYVGTDVEPEWIQEMMRSLSIHKFEMATEGTNDETKDSSKTDGDVTERTLDSGGSAVPNGDQ